MTKKRKPKVIPKNFKGLTKKAVNKRTGDLKRSELQKLFSDKKLKKGLGGDNLIKAAKLISDGFAAKKYTGKNKRKKVIQARRALQDFYDFSTLHGKTKIVKPSKKNRGLYANELGISKKFKYYPMPVFTDKDSYKIIGTGKKKRGSKKRGKKIKLVGEFMETELFEFADRKKAARNPSAEINKLLREIDKKYGRKTFDLKIKCGEYLSHFTTEKSDSKRGQFSVVEDEITLYFERYIQDAKNWLRGIQVTTFKNQVERPLGKSAEKKKPKTKRQKLRMK